MIALCRRVHVPGLTVLRRLNDSNTPIERIDMNAALLHHPAFLRVLISILLAGCPSIAQEPRKEHGNLAEIIFETEEMKQVRLQKESGVSGPAGALPVPPPPPASK